MVKVYRRNQKRDSAKVIADYHYDLWMFSPDHCTAVISSTRGSGTGDWESIPSLACIKALTMPSNDNDPTLPHFMAPMPDAHGQAALLLVESIIHGLLARSIIKTSDAIDIVESAANVQVDVAVAADGHGAPMWHAHTLLTAIADSLRFDLDGSPTPLQPVR